MLLGALALMLVLEGLLPFLSPGLWRRMIDSLIDLPDGTIRFAGLCGMLLGLLILVLFLP